MISVKVGRFNYKQNLLSGSFVILISVLSVFWILHLTFTNVNQRSSEFAVLAALGFSTRTLILILARSAIMALTGGILAVLIFLITSQIYFDPFVLEQLTKELINLAYHFFVFQL